MALVIWNDKEHQTVYASISGKVTNEPELKQSDKGDKIRFSVLYGRKQFMTITAWANSDAGQIASRLEKDDNVMCMGEYWESQYNGKQYKGLSADFVMPSNAPTMTYVPSNPDDDDPEDTIPLSKDDDVGSLPF